jgi:lipopolysaccharide transport system ATP-binding protein
MALLLEDGTVSLRFEDGTVAGVVGPDGAGKGRLLRLAKGGTLVELGPGARDRLEAALAADPKVLLIDHALALVDEGARARVCREIARLARQGSVVVIASHDLALLERVCDVAVVLEDEAVVEQGDPGLVLGNYRRAMLARARAQGGRSESEPRSRHGDRRAEVEDLRVEPATVKSGEPLRVAARLRFHQAVEEPVVGIQIRSRIGVVVYGTNTELEKTEVGARRKGETVEVEFRFRCDLCPGEYTVTVASHDPDGTAHDWLEEAVLFSVIDDRYTAGVANLRAEVAIDPECYNAAKEAG